jgi:Sulfotransferase domain
MSNLDSSDERFAVLVHGLHKSGTMFLYQLMYRLCRERGIRFFSANHPEPNDHLVTPRIDYDFCVGPIRTFETNILDISPRHRICRLFQVRDPRDVLVSQFHSLGWRHTDEGFNSAQRANRDMIRQMTIDEYVLDSRIALSPLVARYEQLMKYQLSDADQIVHYEQMVTDFPDWLAKVVQAFGFSSPGWICRKYAFKYRNEFQPDPDPDSHKRSVVPGGYYNSLQRQTIERLDEQLAPILKAFDYEPTFAGSPSRVLP